MAAAVMIKGLDIYTRGDNPNCISKAVRVIAFQKAKMKNQALRDLQMQRGVARAAQVSSPERTEMQKQE